jgi:hypothetical protein
MFHDEVNTIDLIWANWHSSLLTHDGPSISWGESQQARVYDIGQVQGDGMRVQLEPVTLVDGQFTLHFNNFSPAWPSLQLEYPGSAGVIFNLGAASANDWWQNGNSFSPQWQDAGSVTFTLSDGGIQIVGTFDIGGDKHR